MPSIESPFSRLLVVLAATAFSCPVFAAYDFVSIDYPGAANNGFRGINNAGTVVGDAFDADNNPIATYSYDSKKGTFTALTPLPGSLGTQVLGINELGEMTGQTTFDGVTLRGYIRSKEGVYTTFARSGSSYTQGRAINNHGLVTGFYVDDAADTFNPFIYDTGNNTFIDILPGLDGFNTGSGVNNQGQVVGSVALPAGVACTGCVASVYGWLRDPNGALSFFQVNGAKTRARGITDSGVITGFVDTGPGGAAAGFVTRLTGSAKYESITIPDAQLLVADPAAFVTIPEGINDAGTVVGGWNTAGGNSRGFIATPHVNLNQHGLTGSWYKAATNGQGVEVEVYPNPSGTGSTFVSWFTYDTAIGGAERQRWYTAQGPVMTGLPNASLTIYQNTGGNFDAPPATTAQAVGTATLSFDTCTSGQLSYNFTDGSGRSGMIPLTRLTQNVTCSATTPYPTNADFALSGNWFGGAATSGQGFTAEVNPINGAFFAAWYTYMPSGTTTGAAGQRWYTAQGALTAGMRSIPVTIYETTGGMFDTPTPPGQNTVQVGTGTMTFQSCSAAMFDYSFTGGTSIGLSGTIALSRVASVPTGCASSTDSGAYALITH